MGLIVPVFSYNGRISISFCSAPNLLADASRLASLIEPSLDELEAALAQAALAETDSIQDGGAGEESP